MRTFLLSAVFTAMISLTAFATPPSVVVVRSDEHTIVITRGAGKTEIIKAKSVLDPNKNADLEQFQRVLAGLYEEGYTIQSATVTTAGLVGGNNTVTYILAKP
ncbi:MAG: hypothetical protein JWP58_1607 [Hymenobacter sp.]|nr:hypothetical protein [Hymenobacter sp.]